MVVKGNYNVSFSVIVQHPLLKNSNVTDPFSTIKEHKNIIDAALFHHGMDIRKDVSLQILTHRNVFGKVIENGVLYIGTERTDDVWKGIKKRAAGHDNR